MSAHNGQSPPKEALSVMSDETPLGRLSNSMVASGDNRDATKAAGHLSELHITDAILDSDLSPLAKLLPGLIRRAGGHISYTDFERTLPTTRPAIRPAIRELEEAGFVTVETPRKRRNRSPWYDRPNRYRLVHAANPRAQGNTFTRLPISHDLGRSAGRWILRTVYLREQFWAGAVQIPDAVAAGLAGMTVEAVRVARKRWTGSGILRVVSPSSRTTPLTVTLTSGPYPADLERFDPTKRKLRKVEGDDTTLTVWGTREEAAALRSRLAEAADADTIIEELRRTHGDPARAFHALRDASRLRYASADIPF